MPALASDQFTSGSIAATNGTVTLSTNGYSTVGLSVTGTWSGSLTIRASVDFSYAASPTWITTTAVPVSSGLPLTAITTTGLYQINCGGFSAIQVFGTSIVSGTANIALLGSAGISTVMADNTMPVVQTSQYPSGATPITGNATGSTGAVVGTLAAAVGKTTYICGFNVQAIGGTATVGPITVAGLVGSSQVYQGSSSAAGGTVVSMTFSPPIPASASNTAITITTTADGTATAVDVNSWGYQL